MKTRVKTAILVSFFYLLLAGCQEGIQKNEGNKELVGLNIQSAIEQPRPNSPEGVISNIYNYSQEGRFSEIFELTSPWVRVGMKRDVFVSSSKENNWKIAYLSSSGMTRTGKTARCVLRLRVERNQRSYLLDTVLYLINYEGYWYVENFPFSHPYYPDFIIVPRAFSEGLYHDVPLSKFNK